MLFATRKKDEAKYDTSRRFYHAYGGKQRKRKQRKRNRTEWKEEKRKKEKKKQRQRPRSLVSRFKKFSSTRQEFDFPDASRSTKHGIHSILSITKWNGGELARARGYPRTILNATGMIWKGSNDSSNRISIPPVVNGKDTHIRISVIGHEISKRFSKSAIR